MNLSSCRTGTGRGDNRERTHKSRSSWIREEANPPPPGLPQARPPRAAPPGQDRPSAPADLEPQGHRVPRQGRPRPWLPADLWPRPCPARPWALWPLETPVTRLALSVRLDRVLRAPLWVQWVPVKKRKKEKERKKKKKKKMCISWTLISPYCYGLRLKQ